MRIDPLIIDGIRREYLNGDPEIGEVARRWGVAFNTASKIRYGVLYERALLNQPRILGTKTMCWENEDEILQSLNPVYRLEDLTGEELEISKR